MAMAGWKSAGDESSERSISSIYGTGGLVLVGSKVESDCTEMGASNGNRTKIGSHAQERVTRGSSRSLQRKSQYHGNFWTATEKDGR